MKKSVKCFLLALMVLCLSATAGFAADASYDITISLDISSSTGIYLSKETLTIDSTDLPSIDVTSYDQALSMGDTNALTVSFDYGTTPTFIISFDAATATIAGVYSGDETGSTMDSTNLATTGVPAPADGSSTWIYVGLTGASGKFNTVVKFKVTGAVSGDAPVDAFDKATIKLTTDGDGIFDESGNEITSVDFTSKDYSTAQTIVVSSEVTVSFDLKDYAGVINKVTSGETELTSVDGVYAITAPADGEELSVVFNFASTDTDSVDCTITVQASDGGSGDGARTCLH